VLAGSGRRRDAGSAFDRADVRSACAPAPAPASVGRSWRVAGGSAGGSPECACVATGSALWLAVARGATAGVARLARGARESRPLSARRSPPIRSAGGQGCAAARPRGTAALACVVSSRSGAPADTAARTLTTSVGWITPLPFGRSECAPSAAGSSRTVSTTSDRLVRATAWCERAAATAAASPFDDGIPPPSASRRSRMTLRGKKCSRCWRNTQRSRSTSCS